MREGIVMSLPVLGCKIFLLLAEVEVPLNAFKILYWLVHGSQTQDFLVF